MSEHRMNETSFLDDGGERYVCELEREPVLVSVSRVCGERKKIRQVD